METDHLIVLTANIVSAHVSNNNVPVGDVAGLVLIVHGALANLGAPAQETVEKRVPIVSVRASVKPDYLVCLQCGKKQKTLKRHLHKAHDMTPAQYRQDFGLSREYPLTAPNYSARRAEMARAIGLGRKKGPSKTTKAASTPAKKAVPRRPSRKARSASK